MVMENGTVDGMGLSGAHEVRGGVSTCYEGDISTAEAHGACDAKNTEKVGEEGKARVYLDESGDAGQALFVSDGGARPGEVQWFTALPRLVGGDVRVRRLKRPGLPIRATRGEAQGDLDRYAAAHGLARCCRRCLFTGEFVELGAGGWGASGEMCRLCEEDVRSNGNRDKQPRMNTDKH